MIIDLFDYLQSQNIDVYFIGQHSGDCNSPYIVLKDGGITSYNGKSGIKLLDVIFFMPQNRYSTISGYRTTVMECIKQFGDLRYTGNETPVVTDDSNKSLTFSITYQIFMKLEG